jgi:proline iminopeptidase
MEYALKYQKNLKGLIISNMMASAAEYNAYAKDVLAPQTPKILKQLQDIENNNDFDNQNTVNYFSNIITPNMY